MRGTRNSIAMLAVTVVCAQPPPSSSALVGDSASSQVSESDIILPLVLPSVEGSAAAAVRSFTDTVVELPGRHYWTSRSVASGLGLAPIKFASSMKPNKYLI